MRFILIICFLFCNCSVQQTVSESNVTAVKTYLVSGKLDQKLSYCGGAPPSQKILDNFKIPKPLKGYKIYIKHGDENVPSAAIIDSTVTDNFGMYYFTLARGQYTILTHTQLSRSNLDSMINHKYLEIYDQGCLEKWFNKGLISFNVLDKSISDLNFTRIKKCDIPDGIPCINYTGPLRP